MATLDDVLTLARAGFTAEQITGLLQPAAPEAQPAPAQPETPQAPPAAPAQPAPQAAPAQTEAQPAAQPDPYAKLMEELGQIKAQIQQSNRSQAQQPEAQQLTGDQVLANIIAPPRKAGAK
jgi:hypothetical protein